MTIAAGFVARDGVLLCTDSQYSSGVKVNGRKIFTFQLDDAVISFAIAGHEPFAKNAVFNCKDVLEANRGAHASISSIKAIVDQVVRDTYETLVEATKLEDDPRFQLIIAIGTRSENPALFYSCSAAVNPVENFECVGSGYFVGHQIIGAAYQPGMDLEQLVVIGLHALAVAKECVDGVGGPSQIECICSRGMVTTQNFRPAYSPYDNSTFMEIDIREYERIAARFLLDISDHAITEEQFDTRGKLFFETAHRLRKKFKDSMPGSEIIQAIRSAK